MSVDPHPLAISAVILAAGSGSRLRVVHGDQPKGLVEVGGTAIIARSLGLLLTAGVTDLVLVAGWQADSYRAFLARHFPTVRLALNLDFATTGSLASLVIGARVTTGDVLIVESDLLYESRALAALLAAPERDTLLASGPTGSGDEVWTYGRDRRLARLDKQRWSGAPHLGELVGLTRLSRPVVDALLAAATALPASADYEDGLNAVCAVHPVTVLTLPDLAWCEIDDPTHLARARELVWPRLATAP